MPKVHPNTAAPPDHIRNRAEIAADKATKKQEGSEKKKGALDSLKTKFADFKALIKGVESKRAVEKRLASTQASAPMTKAQTEAAFKNIREQRTANIPAREKAHSTSSKPVSSGSSGTLPIDPRLKNPLMFFDPPPPPPPSDDPGPLPPSYISKPPTAKELNAPEQKKPMALKSAVDKAIFTLIKEEPNHPYCTRENINKFVTTLNKCLGSAEGGITLKEADFMFAMSVLLEKNMNEADFQNLTMHIDDAMVRGASE